MRWKTDGFRRRSTQAPRSTRPIGLTPTGEMDRMIALDQEEPACCLGADCSAGMSSSEGELAAAEAAATEEDALVEYLVSLGDVGEAEETIPPVDQSGRWPVLMQRVGGSPLTARLTL